MLRFAAAFVLVLLIPALAQGAPVQGGIIVGPVVTVSTDTTNPLATITISLYAGSDSATPTNVNSYAVDIALADISPALTSVTLSPPSVVTGSSWSATNFTTATGASIISGNAGFRFTGSRSGSNISMLQLVSGNASFLLGTATLTAARPAIGAGDASYAFSLGVSTYNFTEDPATPLFKSSNIANFTIAAQTAAAVPEPASVVLLVGSAVGFGWRRYRYRKC